MSGPSIIYVIRHGEKKPEPGDVGPPQSELPEYGPPTDGVTISGDQAASGPAAGAFDPVKDSLIPRGWQRAGALVALFGTPLAAGGRFQRPDMVFAGGYAVRTEDHRCHETVQPLAERLGTTTVDQYLVGADEGAAMKAALACDGVVLLCWEHHQIWQPEKPDTDSDAHHAANYLVSSIPQQAVDRPPRAWPDSRFDLVWRFTRHTDDGNYAWDELFQDVLAGDTSSGDSG